MQPALDVRGLIRPRRDDEFFGEVIAGLGSQPKTVPSKWLWDERGARLHERVRDTPDHYLARAERSLLDAHGHEISRELGPRSLLVDVAPRDASRVRALLDRLEEPVAYVPLDPSTTRLEELARALRRDHRGLEIAPLVAGHALPRSTDLRERIARIDEGNATVWLGDARIGEIAPHDAVSMLARAALLAGSRGRVLVSFDLKKPKRVIEAAYLDRSGANAAFHRNVLVRINREIGATFDVTRFSFRAPYDPIRGRVEMRLVSECAQHVLVGGCEIALAKGEWIVGGHAYKYDAAELTSLVRRAGLEIVRSWTDPGRRMSLCLLAARGGGHARA
ncbi:L-histidine N(alpha)-methyltransferase [Sandaracinus amylolyticus]|uniref:Histidine-specific methyltransferase SAM-dependent domain-containing protein n=1 Tax=Sandaracinus amylolyticus TaxID=927083 RepID=A0A0F6SF14_9BACT|nr:L-histidine N(alpha)-methyltransferase [Sandaracinus amylolyticus]AKF06149.1 hypothetical protein DB32_003298 [Sandaracinus amylolyticus]